MSRERQSSIIKDFIKTRTWGPLLTDRHSALGHSAFGHSATGRSAFRTFSFMGHSAFWTFSFWDIQLLGHPAFETFSFWDIQLPRRPAFGTFSFWDIQLLGHQGRKKQKLSRQRTYFNKNFPDEKRVNRFRDNSRQMRVNKFSAQDFISIALKHFIKVQQH